MMQQASRSAHALIKPIPTTPNDEMLDSRLDEVQISPVENDESLDIHLSLIAMATSTPCHLMHDTPIFQT